MEKILVAMKQILAYNGEIPPLPFSGLHDVKINSTTLVDKHDFIDKNVYNDFLR